MENRPVAIAQGGVTAGFAYGPNGERFRKVRGGATTLWLGTDIELLPDGTLLEQLGELGRIAGTPGSGGVREWLHRDGLASNRLMTDAAGIRVQHSHYPPFGDRSGPLTVDENGGPAARPRASATSASGPSRRKIPVR